MSIIYEFSDEARVFVRLGWKSLPGTNTLTYYKNSQIADKESFIKLGPALILSPNLAYFFSLKNGFCDKMDKFSTKCVILGYLEQDL